MSVNTQVGTESLPTIGKPIGTTAKAAKGVTTVVARATKKLNLPTKVEREKDKSKYRNLNEEQKAAIAKDLKAGLSIWETTEKFFHKKLEHSRKYKDITWWYYGKVNGVRHELGLENKKVLSKNPETVFALNTLIQKVGESKAREILAKAMEGVKSPSS